MLAPGTHVDRYVIGQLLGKGGMAAVYAARHDLLGSWHAIKVLHAADATQQERLIREGRVQARLDPSLVVPVTDVIRIEGASALVMPLVRGQGLDLLLARVQPTPAEALALFRAIVTSVAHAHAHGVVHRDLKPSNVLVDHGSSGLRLRVADFGLVRALRDQPLAAEAATRTRRGMMMGSPSYASPEQLADAAHADRRADVWSLGVILYELCTGLRPFEGEDLASLIRAVHRGSYDIEPVPAPVRALVAACLDQRISERPETAGELLTMLPPAEAKSLALGSRLAEALVLPPEPAPPGRMPAPEARPTLAPALTWMDTPSQPAHALPGERDTFFGREDATAQLERLIADGARLISIVGMGGTGKTRFATHFGWQSLERWPGGVWFCDLSEAQDLDDITSEVARVLGVPLGRQDPVQQLGLVLAASARCLVVLDNFEQIVGHASACLDAWRDLASDAVFIVTTREVLHLSGEHVLPLSPLPMPDAASLFIARAQASLPGFEVDEAQAIVVQQLVERLDGLPLALELAAARVRTLPPERILARLQDRFRLLSSRDKPARQATLRATLDWSWDLMTPHERAALAQLAVFEGGFDLEAAEALVELPEPDAPWTVDLIEALLDKSLLRNLGEERFGMLVSVQAYASEKLDALGGRDAAELRHMDFFAAMGGRPALRALRTAGGSQRRELLRRDLDNLVVAHRRAMARGLARPAARLALASWAAVMLFGPYAPGQARLEASLQLPGLRPADRLDLLRMHGVACEYMGDATAAHESTSRALEIAKEVGDPEREAEVLAHLGNTFKAMGDLPKALEHSLRGREVARACGHIHTEAVALGNVGVVQSLMGDLPAAEASLREALALSRKAGDEREDGIRLGSLGTVAGMLGRLDEAKVLFTRSLAVARAGGARRSMGFMRMNLGIVASHQGDREAARGWLGKAYETARSIGDRGQQAAALSYLGSVEMESGDHPAAARSFARVRELSEELGDRRRLGQALGYLGRIARLAGSLSEAREWLHAALADGVGSAAMQPRWRLELALVHLAAGDLQEARSTIRQACQEAEGLPPVLAEALLAQARVHLAEHDVDSAAASLAKARGVGVQGRTEALAHTVDAELALHRGERDAARAALHCAQALSAWNVPGTEVADRIAAIAAQLHGSPTPGR